MYVFKPTSYSTSRVLKKCGNLSVVTFGGFFPINNSAHDSIGRKDPYTLSYQLPMIDLCIMQLKN
jgi:hypothetical protein